MATTNFFDAFGYEWAESGSVVSLQDGQYKAGWAFIGSTPPSVEQFNAVQKITDEKANWLYAQFSVAAAARGVIVTAASLDVLQNLLNTMTAPASETVAGIAEIATSVEAQAGTDNTRIITPAGLASRTATDARTGLVELATAVETQTGTDATRAVTPAGLVTRVATETAVGLVELANGAETQAGTDDTRAVTPLGLLSRFATTTRTGIVELATAAEAAALSSASLALTPSTLLDIFSGGRISIGENGWMILPSGLIIQWGNVKVDLGTSGTFYTYSLPRAFPAVFYTILAGSYNNTVPTAVAVTAGKVGLGQIKVSWSTASTEDAASFLAIGR